MNPSSPTSPLSLQDAWYFGNARRRAFAASAANPSFPGWKSCDNSGDAACPIGGYYHDGGGVGPRVYGTPDLDPSVAAINHAILAGTVVYDVDGITLIVKATKQVVGLINGAIILPGQAPIVNPPAPFIPPVGPSPSTLTPDQVKSISAIPSMQSDLSKVKSAINALGVQI